VGQLPVGADRNAGPVGHDLAPVKPRGARFSVISQYPNQEQIILGK
jgi:hypothetical protein